MANHFEKDKFEEIFKEKLGEYVTHEHLPSWQMMSARIYTPWYKRYYLPYAAAVVLFLTTGVATWSLRSYIQFEQTNVTISESMMNLQVPNDESAISDVSSVLPTEEPMLSSVAYPAKDHLPVQRQDNAHPVAFVLPEEETVESKPQEVNSNASTERQVKHAKSSKTPKSKASLVAYDLPIKQQIKRTNIQISLLASNSLGENQGSIDNDRAFLATEDCTFSTVNGVFAQRFASHQISGYKHQLPIRFGATVSYGFAPRWGVVTGLTYSLLRSEFTHVMDQAVEGSQHLHYLGVPLYLQFKIWENKRFELYASAGGEVNFNLQSKFKFDTFTQSHTEDVTQREPIFGLGLKMGASYKIWKNSGIFIEPEFTRYYTDAQIPSYWSENDFSCSLALGVRTNF